MKHTLICPQCKDILEIPEKFFGQTITCPACHKQQIDVPTLHSITQRATNEWAWGDFWAFRKMVAPILIKILFWVGVVGCLVCGISLISEGANAYRGGEARIGGGFLFILLGPFAVRLVCEYLIVIFVINETLTDIKNILKSNQSPHQE